MTDIETYFPSCETVHTSEALQPSTNSALKASDAPPLMHNNVEDANNTEAVAKFVVKAARPNSKLILQNMEEVLNSVKEKHRQKHRRKREQRKLAQMQAAAAGVPLATPESRNHGEKSKSDKKHRKRSTQPLKEKSVHENGQQNSHQSKHKPISLTSPLKNSSTNGDILRHFQRTPKKNELSSDAVPLEETQESKEQEKDVIEIGDMADKALPTKKVNAFEVMMNARNKIIGSNTQGVEVSPSVSNPSPSNNSQRKIMLQEWADRKGGAKRKLEEEARAAFVDHRLAIRVKRFKQMLVKDNSPKEECASTSKSVHERPGYKEATKPDNTKKCDEKKKRTRRSKRFDSTDSLKQNEITTNNLTPDAETAEFLSKLSSPTKKRDSLLGYFPRKESPAETKVTQTVQDKVSQKQTSEVKTATPKPRGRRSKTSSTQISTDVIETPEESAKELSFMKGLGNKINEEQSTPCGRPKRSCAGKARYDYDLEVSPTKPTKVKRNASSKTALEVEDDVITLDESNSTLSPYKPKKLAPVFVRSVPKPNLDPAILRARQEFLMSSVPDKMRLEMAKQKQYEEYYEEAVSYFPQIAHIQQLSKEEQIFVEKSPKSNMKFKLKDIEDIDIAVIGGNKRARRTPIRSSTMKQSKQSKMSESRKSRSFHVPLPEVENKRNIIKSWKSDFENFPTYKCYNQMREKYRYFSAIDSGQDTEQVNESFVVTRRSDRVRETHTIEIEDVKPPPTAPNGELLFTEKYKPMLYEQVLVNLISVSELRDFLAGWANDIGGSIRNSQTLEDSFDIVNDSNSSLNTVCNSVVLLGPHSSGKTSAVYALANEFNFNVLEINAGMKRTGKRLMQELQEATQSHQIRKDAISAQMKSHKKLSRMPLNGQKYRKQSSQIIDGESNSSLELSPNARKCLILIEDADVVFDQMDAGFTDAIYTLAASSKRPVIIMATDPNCAHLQRLMSQNTIKFTTANSLNISRFMCVLSLVENCPINLDDLVSLYLYNGRDLRRTLLEVQFFIQSGGDRKPIKQTAIQQLQRTPEKCNDEAKKRGFFASPTKRSLSVEPTHISQEIDDQLARNKNTNDNNSTDSVYLHRTLFEFYTIDQNMDCRVPFPVNFNLLRSNLTDLLQSARRLKIPCENVCNSGQNNSTEGGISQMKRKSRSPKKAWLTSATSNTEQINMVKMQTQPIDILCDFYENLSVAALLDAHTGLGHKTDIAAYDIDRLQPHLEENIAHELVELSITELGIPLCPYNFFETPNERNSLCNHLALPLRSQRTRALDYEPMLRSICRSEKHRASQERRSTRFYHYLRNSTSNVGNLVTEEFDRACKIMQEEEPDDKPTVGSEDPNA